MNICLFIFPLKIYRYFLKNNDATDCCLTVNTANPILILKLEVKFINISSSLRQLRLDKGMTQEQVAEQIGVTRQALSSYESGRTRPDIDMLMCLCDVYETNLDSILYGQSQTLKSLRRVRVTAIVIFVLLTVLTS